MDLLLQLAVPDPVRGVPDGPRRLGFIPAPVATDLVESLFQSLDALGQLLLLPRNIGDGLPGPLPFEILDSGADPVLCGPEPSRLVKRGVHIAPETSAPLSVEVAPRAAQGVRGGQSALEPLATVSPAGGPHVLRRIPQPARDRREVRTGTFASQTLKPPGDIFGFGGQLVLGRAGPAPGWADAAANAFVLLLLAAGQLRQPLEYFIHFVVRGGTLLLFHRLVLVSEFVHLQFEEARQILRLYRWGAAATTTTATLSKGDLDVTEHGVRALQVGQRLLFAGEGVFGLAGHQQLFGNRHLDETRIEVVHDFGKLRARPNSAVPEAPGERLDLFPQAPLGQTDGGDGFGNRAGGHSLAVPENLEGGHHDLLLAHAQGAVEPIPGASASARHGVPLPEGSVKRLDRDEEHVGRGFRAGPVPRHRIVGDEVSRNEVVFLEEQRVSRLDLLPGSSGRQHLAGFFPSVDGNPHLEPPDRIVVFGQHFDEYLFYRICLAVPSRPHESHDGRHVLENFDQVVPGRGSQVFVRPGERDPVRPRLGEREGRGQHFRARPGWRFLRPPGLEGDFHRSRLQPQDAGRRRDRGDHFQFHHGAGHGGDVPSVLDFPRAEAGVVRITVGKPDLRHVGDILDLDPKRRREHPVRVDVIVRRVRNPEQEMPKGAVLGIGQHRDRFPNRRSLDAGPEVHPRGGEPFEPGLDPAIRVARHRRIPRLHMYPVRVRVGDVGPGREEQGGSAKQRRRSEKRSHNRHPTDGGQRPGGPPEPGGLDEATLLQRL